MNFCYICGNELEKFKDPDNTGNYQDHYSCYNCPSIEYDEHECKNIAAIWKVPYSIIYRDNKLSCSYLYLKEIKIYLSSFFLKNNPFTYIKSNKGELIHTLEFAVNPFDFSYETLENKIKMILVFH